MVYRRGSRYNCSEKRERWDREMVDMRNSEQRARRKSDVRRYRHAQALELKTLRVQLRREGCGPLGRKFVLPRWVRNTGDVEVHGAKCGPTLRVVKRFSGTRAQSCVRTRSEALKVISDGQVIAPIGGQYALDQHLTRAPPTFKATRCQHVMRPHSCEGKRCCVGFERALIQILIAQAAPELERKRGVPPFVAGAVTDGRKAHCPCLFAVDEALAAAVSGMQEFRGEREAINTVSE